MGNGKNRLIIILGITITGLGFDSTAEQIAHRELASVENTARVVHAKELLGGAYAKSVVKKAERHSRLQVFIYEQINAWLPAQWKSESWTLAQTIIEESRQHRFDPIFLMAVIAQESRFKPDAIGGHGEIGLMQIRPNTAEWITGKLSLEWKGRESLTDLSSNVRIGTAYLAFLRKRFPAKGDLYLAAYNMGASKVRRALKKQISPRIYSSSVMQKYLSFYTVLNKRSLASR